MRAFLAAISVMLTSQPANACVVPHLMSQKYPVCKVPVAATEEDILAIRLEYGGGVSSYQLPPTELEKDYDGLKTRVVDIEIRDGTQPLYIIVSSYARVIWRLNGNVASVSRLLVLGSESSGAKNVGVIGLAKDKIDLAETGPGLYEPGELTITRSDVQVGCNTPPSKACYPDDYLYRFSDPQTPGIAVVKIGKWWDQVRAGPSVNVTKPGVIQAEQLEPAKFASFKDKVAVVRLPALVAIPATSEEPVAIDPRDVIMPPTR